ncbi:MAG: CPBP family intramembrane metalloprotease [Bacteroidales bacterium]|nr:CPBP family intramembrane metalloprotease [Bacteroidales bacterium]
MSLSFDDMGKDNLLFVFAITATIVGYYGYYYLSQSESIKDWFVGRFLGKKFWLRWILFQKICGFIFMGLIPGIIYIFIFNGRISDFGMNLNLLISNWYWLIGIPMLMVVINRFLAQGKSLQQQYPQMRLKRWSKEMFALSAFGWIIYLLAYEYLFRGLLLFLSYEAFGFWPAIAINVAIYSALHMTKGAGETLGAIPFGILTCIITLSTGTMLIPVFAHIGLAVSMDYFALKYNPEMELNSISGGSQ